MKNRKLPYYRNNRNGNEIFFALEWNSNNCGLSINMEASREAAIEYGVNDSRSDIILAASFDHIEVIEKEDWDTINNRNKYVFFRVQKDDKVGIFVSSVNVFTDYRVAFVGGVVYGWLLDPRYDKLEFLAQSDMFRVQLNGKVGVYDISSSDTFEHIGTEKGWILGPEYAEIELFVADKSEYKFYYFLAITNNKYGLWFKNQCVIEPECERLSIATLDPHCSLVLINMNGKLGIHSPSGDPYNNIGRWVVRPKHDRLDMNRLGSCWIICSNNKFGLLNDQGSWLLSGFDSLTFKKAEDMHLVYANGKYGLLDSNSANLILVPQYANLHIRYIGNDEYSVKADSTSGIVQKSGKWRRRLRYHVVDRLLALLHL